MRASGMAPMNSQWVGWKIFGGTFELRATAWGAPLHAQINSDDRDRPKEDPAARGRSQDRRRRGRLEPARIHQPRKSARRRTFPKHFGDEKIFLSGAKLFSNA